MALGYQRFKLVTQNRQQRTKEISADWQLTTSLYFLYDFADSFKVLFLLDMFSFFQIAKEI